MLAGAPADGSTEDAPGGSSAYSHPGNSGELQQPDSGTSRAPGSATAGTAANGETEPAAAQDAAAGQTPFQLEGHRVLQQLMGDQSNAQHVPVLQKVSANLLLQLPPEAAIAAATSVSPVEMEVNRIRAHQARLPRNDERRTITACAPSCFLNLTNLLRFASAVAQVSFSLECKTRADASDSFCSAIVPSY